MMNEETLLIWYFDRTVRVREERLEQTEEQGSTGRSRNIFLPVFLRSLLRWFNISPLEY